MIIFESFKELIHFSENAVISIGNFDGVHRGHQELIRCLNSRKKEINGRSLIITFSNHPATILYPNKVPDLLSSPEHKLHLLENSDIDAVLFLPFTKELSQLAAKAFIEKLRSYLPFTDLILGYDAAFGKGRFGDKGIVQALALENKFNICYVNEVIIDGHLLSSTLIRQYIRDGNLQLTEKLLGRHYSIFGPVVKGQGYGKKLGFPTINISTEGLCLPPFGIYCTRITLGEKKMQGIANLGAAPAMHHGRGAMLEVHLFDFHDNIYGKEVEVTLESYLRPERHFDNADLLIEQIQNDIAKAKRCLT